MAQEADNKKMDVNQDAFLRIKADKVAELMDLVGVLGLSVGEVLHHPDLSDYELEGFRLSAHRLNLLVQETQDLTASLSLVQVNMVFSRMRRVIRDLARQTGKKLELKFHGEEVEIDKRVLDSLYEPLVHLVRNSVDHGLESTEQREASGKNPTGTVTLSAVQHGSEIHIGISDDGKGLSRSAILSKARERNLIEPDESPTDSALWRYIFHPGFSTAEAVSNLSGRGVGMDVVNSTIESLRGHIHIESEEGKGTDVVLKIPMTLAFLECFVVRVGNRLLALAIDAVSEVFKPNEEQIVNSAADNSENIQIRGTLLPVRRIQDFYGEEFEKAKLIEQVIVTVTSSKGRLCLPVDEIIGQQLVTIKPLQGRLSQIRASSGCAILNTGEVAIALDCERLAEGNDA